MEPTGVSIGTQPVAALDDRGRERYAGRIAGLLDPAWMLQELARIVDIPSPTGEERPLAAHLVSLMRELGLKARVQPIDALSANAIGELGDGDGPSVMLFAPLDSAFSGVEAEEVPWSGPALRLDQRPVARIEGDGVIGLSADNPKAHIVAIVSAVAALRKAEVPLSGRVVIAFGAGGAPSNKRPSLARWNVGHGTGCEYLLQQGVRADFAIVTKPGYAVQWEEVGVCWFRVRVHGVQSYVGRKHVLAEDNPIVKAAALVPLLEEWFSQYAARHTDGLVAPQAAIGAIEGGWTYKPAFTPAACDLYIDMRISPRSSPMEAWRELNAALRRFQGKDPSLKLDCKLIAAVEGPATPQTSWIVQSCIRAWEAVEGRKHEPLKLTSGQTEAVILRRHGIPTARIGLPAQMSPGAERPKHTMGVTKIAGAAKLAEVLARALIDTCTRNLEEVRRDS
jgi:acetylornithine deacetylase/succinyl-diaminopimelate desuccinylase-like protein